MADHSLPGGPQSSPGYWLYHAALAWTAAVTERLSRLGLTQPQFMVLASIGWLSRSGTSPMQQQVSDYSGVDRMLTSRLVRRLEDAQLVARTPDAADGRAIRLSLTPKGRTVSAAAIAAVRTLDDVAFGEDPAAVRDMLQQVTMTNRDLHRG